MPLTTTQFASDLIDAFIAQGVTFTNAAALKTTTAAKFTDWLGGSEALPADLAYRLSTALGQFQGEILERYDFWTGTTSGGPHGNGTYDLTLPDGTVVAYPCLAVLVQSTAKGDPAGLAWNFSTTTADADPGAGQMRANNATLASVTQLYFDNLEAGGASVTAWLDALDDSSATVKGTLKLTQVDDQTKWALFNVTGSVVDGTGYRKVTVAFLAGSSLPAAGKRVVASFNASIAGSGDVVGPGSATNGNLALFNGATGKIIKDGGPITALGLTLVGGSTAAAMRSTLGLVIGTDVLPMSGGTLTGALTLAADPTNALHAATKQYVDNLAAGLDVKKGVRAATTANITLSGAQTIDGVSVVAGDRVLVKDQTTPAQNGLYVAAAGAWGRATDMDAWAEVPGASVWVQEGSVNADRAYVCTSNAGGTLGTTAISWTQFGGTGAFQSANTNLTALAGLTGAAGKVAYFTGAGAMALADSTAFGRSLLNVADAAAALTLIGAAPASRTVTGAGLVQGGGALTADRTFTVPPATNTEAVLGFSTTAAMTPAADAAALDNAFEILEKYMLNDSVATLGQAAANVRRGVEVQAARSNGARRFRVGLKVSTALTDVATVTRATQAWGVDQGGNVGAVAAGQPVVNTAGLAVYEARTNSVRNPTFQGTGGGKGTTGATINGNVPNNMYLDGAPGVTLTVIGVGTEGGAPYIDIDVAGTPTLSPHMTLNFDSGGIAAVNGEVWTLASGVKLLSGSLTSVSAVTHRIVQMTASSSPISNLISTSFVGSVNGASRYDASSQFTLDGGATLTQIGGYLAFSGSASAVAYRIRVYAPQMKRGADIKDPPILQTNNAAATRNADIVSEAINVPSGQAFTVIWRGIAPAAAANFGRLVSLHDNVSTLRNYVILYLNQPATAVFVGLSSAGVTTANPNKACTPGAPLAVVVSVAGNQITWSVNGSAASTHTLTGGQLDAALQLMALGYDPSTDARQLNSTIRDMQIVMRAYSAAECAAASDVSLTHDVDFVSQVYQYVGAPYVTPTDLPGTTFTRATTGTSRVGATILNFAAGVLKITSAGCLFEAQKTNVVRYSEGTTATIGTWGVSGSGPNDGANGVSQGGALNGLVISTSAKGTYADGCDWWEFTLAGTPTASSSTGFYLDANSLAGAASSGQTWVSAVDLEFMSMTGCAGSTIQTFGRKSDGSSNEGGGLVNLPTTPTSRARYASGAYTMADVLTARVSGGVFFAYTSGVPLNVVVRVTAAQVERDYVSSYKKTTGSAVTGNADNLASANDNNPTSYTVVAEFTIPATGPAYSHVWTYDDGTFNGNRSFVYYDRSTGKICAAVEVGAVAQAFFDLGVVTAGQTYKVAFAVAANDFAAIRSGGTVQTGTAGTVPSTSAFRIGRSYANGNEWGGFIRRIRRFSVRKTNSELQALVA